MNPIRWASRGLTAVLFLVAAPTGAGQDTVCETGRHRNCVHTRMRGRRSQKNAARP